MLAKICYSDLAVLLGFICTPPGAFVGLLPLISDSLIDGALAGAGSVGAGRSLLAGERITPGTGLVRPKPDSLKSQSSVLAAGPSSGSGFGDGTGATGSDLVISESRHVRPSEPTLTDGRSVGLMRAVLISLKTSGK